MTTKKAIWFVLVVAFDVALSATKSVPDSVAIVAWAITLIASLAWVSYHYFGDERGHAQLVFDPNDTTHHVLHGNLVAGPERRFRIGVVNLSKATVQRCRLVLEGVEPFDKDCTYLGKPLGDRLPKDGIFDLNPRDDGHPSEYVDVFHEIVAENLPVLSRLTYAPADWQSPMFKNGGKYFEHPPRDRTVVVRLEGVDLKPVRMRLFAKLNSQGSRYDVSCVPLP